MNTSRLKVDEYRDGILEGDRVILARAITLMESTLTDDQELAEAVLTAVMSRTGKSLRIGITGAPGVGKSTFIEAFGNTLIETGHKLAVLTIDPTSQVTLGSILGDKTRMATLSRNPHAYIRPSPAGHTLGGVASHTREAILLCEAAGFDRIIVETVGTGQSEITIRSMVDFFLLLIQPGSGDELQGIKKGVVEMADAIVVTKADGDNARLARSSAVDFQHALHLLKPQRNGWTPKVMTCSSLESTGFTDILDAIDAFYQQTSRSGYFEQNRRNQNTTWFRDHFQRILTMDPHRYPLVAQREEKLNSLVLSGAISPRQAAHELLRAYHESIKKDAD